VDKAGYRVITGVEEGPITAPRKDIIKEASKFLGKEK
jgi:hypothetical protein